MSTSSPKSSITGGTEGTTGAQVALGGRAPADLAAALRSDGSRVAAVAEVEGQAGADRARARSVARPAFGLSRLLPEDSEIHALRVASYEDKLACIDAIDHFAAERNVRGKYREAIVQCVDELLMNALYGAPRAAATGRSSGDQLDAAAIAARAHRGVRMSWAYVDRVFYVSALDGYGSLDRGAFLGAMSAGAEGDDSGSSDGGSPDAGLGVKLIAGSCSHMWITVAAGEASECLCAFDTGTARLQLCELGFVEVSDSDDIAAVGGELELGDELARRAHAERSSGPGLTIALALAIAVIVAIVLVLVLRG